MHRSLPALIVGLWILAAGTASAGDRQRLTLYSQGVAPAAAHSGAGLLSSPVTSLPGRATVERWSDIQLPAGYGQHTLEPLSEALDPTTLQLDFPTQGGDIQVVEQEVVWPRRTREQQLPLYLGREIVVERIVGNHLKTTRGTLLGYQDGISLQLADGHIHLIRNSDSLQLPPDHPAPTASPMARWQLTTRQAGRYRAHVRYETTGITWWPTYTLRLPPQDQDCQLDLSAQIQLLNHTGVDFQDTELLLIAGELHRSQRPRPQFARTMTTGPFVKGPATPQQAAIGELYSYRFAGTLNLNDSTLLQRPLFPSASGIPCTRPLRFEANPGLRTATGRPLQDIAYGRDSDTPVTSLLQFANRRTQGLGRPLPSGQARVFEVSNDLGGEVLIGEDLLPHVALGGNLELRLGSAFDVRGKRLQEDFQLDKSRRRMEEEIRITLHNAKATAVEVQVLEHPFRWHQWEILSHSTPYRQIDANTLRFSVTVPPGGESTLRYRIRYHW